MANMVEVLNTIRDNASSSYKNRIPVATQTNIDQVGAAMLDGDNIAIANEFTSLLVNKIVKTVFHHKTFNNPLKMLKKGKKPLGDGVEEIYMNFLKGEEYDATGVKLLERTLPDVKVVYHRMNRKNQYPVSINRDLLAKGFKSYENLETMLKDIINKLYSSAEFDEFLMMKSLLTEGIKDGAVKMVEVTGTASDPKGMIKDIKKVSKLMSFPSDQFNGYLSIQDVDTKPIITVSKPEEQVLILDVNTDVDIAIEVLAASFNMSVAEFNETRKIIIDAFPEVEGKEIHAMLIDDAFMQIYDDLFTMTDFYNGRGLYTSYFLNVWQTFAYSGLVNAVAFYSPKAA